MVSFTGGAGPVNGVGSIFEWSDVFVIIENNAIVDYYTQFSGDALPGIGMAVSIGGGFEVQLTSLTYRHIGGAVGAGTLDISNGATFRQLADGFTMSGKLTNNGLLQIYADTVATGAIENNNLMTVGDDNTFTDYLMLAPVAGAFTLSGSGDLRLRDGFVTGQGGQSSITHLQNSSTISGTGGIGADFGNAAFPGGAGYLRITNTAAGTIEADVSGRTLTINTQLTSINPLTNAGLLAASNGGKLVIEGSLVTQSGAGTIKAFNASTVELKDVTLVGGTIDGQGTGVVAVKGFTTSIEGIDITATGILNLGTVVTLKAAIENRGKIIADGFDGDVNIDGNGVVFSGGGSLQMVGAYTNSAIRGAAGAILTNLDHTIFGVGEISGSNLALVNSGMISARPDAYSTGGVDTLNIDTLSSVTNGNGGIIEASGAATLRIGSTTVNNDGGTIRAVGADAVVSLAGATLYGGTFHTASGGVIRTDSFGVRLSDFQTTATTMINAAAGLALEGPIVNRGTIFVENFNAAISIDADDVLLSGGGTVILYDNYGDAAIIGESAGAVLTNSNNTIRGDGFIGGANLTLANSGFIYADADPREDGVGNLRIQDLAAFTNVGTIGAINGANLHLNNPGSGEIANTGGTIRSAGAGSVVHLGNSVIEGGTLIGVTGGKFTATNATWDGTAAKVTATNVNIDSAGILRLKGTIEYSGQTHFHDRGELVIEGNTTLSGGGSFFTHYGYIAEGIIRASAAGITLTNINNTLGGRGSFGGWSGLVFTNGAAGTVTANETGATLFVNTGNAITNNGRLLANGGIIDILDNLTGTGRIEITGGGTAIVDQGTDQRVVFVGASADTLSLSRREAVAGGYDFQVSGMGIGDRIRFDIGYGAGAERDFTFASTGAVTTFADTVFADGMGVAYALQIVGKFSEGQFQLIGGPDNLLSLIRVASRDGGTGNDSLTAVAAGERLIGFEGNDTLTSGIGNDVLDGSSGSDRAVYTAATSGVTIDLNQRTSQDVGGGQGMDRLLSIENLDGSNFNDTFTGNAEANNLRGLGGNDTLKGGAGSDVLQGGLGGDLMEGGAGNDTYEVDNAGDIVDESIAGSDGIDTVNAAISVNIGDTTRFKGSVENVTLLGSLNLNVLGNNLNNVLTGNSGNNTLNGGVGFDNMRGGAGNDIYYVDHANDIVDESIADSSGIDTVNTTVSIDLTNAARYKGDIENVTLLGSANLNALGNALGNILTGNAGANTLNGGLGDDLMLGGAGNDIYTVDNVGDVVDESVAGSNGTDLVRSTISFSLADTVHAKGAIENLTLLGTGNHNALGNDLANLLIGNSGANTLNGGLGADTMQGGAGNDNYTVDNAGDVVDESVAGSGGVDTIRSTIGFSLADMVHAKGAIENLTLLGTANLNGLGNDLANVLTGNSGNNTLNGGLGADILRGGAGNDNYAVDTTSDVVDESVAGSNGIDVVRSVVNFNLANTAQVLGLVENVTLLGTANISAFGNALANVLIGNNGVNLLAGGLGNDTLTGGAGNDVFLFDTALGAANVDTITDMNEIGNDTIRLENAVFTALTTTGVLAATAFHIGTTAADASDRIIYNNINGQLSYDINGSGAGGSVVFAILDAGLALTAADFVVV